MSTNLLTDPVAHPSDPRYHCRCSSPGPVSPGGSPGPQGSTYPADWKIAEKLASFVHTAPEPFFGYAGTSILHPPYQTNEYWYGVANTPAPLPAWPPVASMHPCDVQAASKRGCTPGMDNETAYAAFYSPQRIDRVRRVYLAELEVCKTKDWGRVPGGLKHCHPDHLPQEFDAIVGTVIAALRAAGRAEHTYVVLAADHGDMQLEHQMFYKVKAEC